MFRDTGLHFGMVLSPFYAALAPRQPAAQDLSETANPGEHSPVQEICKFSMSTAIAAMLLSIGQHLVRGIRRLEMEKKSSFKPWSSESQRLREAL